MEVQALATNILFSEAKHSSSANRVAVAMHDQDLQFPEDGSTSHGVEKTRAMNASAFMDENRKEVYMGHWNSGEKEKRRSKVLQHDMKVRVKLVLKFVLFHESESSSINAHSGFRIVNGFRIIVRSLEE